MNKLYILAAAALGLAACNSDENNLGAFEIDPNAVHFSVQIAGENQATLATKAQAETAAFADGAKIAVTAGKQAEVNYILSVEAWNPESADKYLLWEKATGLEFNAYYPVGVNGASLTDFTLPSGYTTADELENANYMTASTTANKKDGTVSLMMEHKMARAIVKVTNVQNQYTDFKVSSIKMHVNYNAYQGGVKVAGTQEVEMLPQDANKTFYALVVPTDEAAAETFLTITGADNGGSSETLTVKGIPAMEAGSSYTFKLTIGKVEAKVSGVTVKPWTDGNVLAEGEAEEVVAQAWPKIDPVNNIIETNAEGQLTTENIAQALNGSGKLVVKGKVGNDEYKSLANNVKELDLSGADITTLPNYTFSNCTKMETIVLPATVTIIPERCFFGCTTLTKVTCKGNITEINSYAFYTKSSSLTVDLTANTSVAKFAAGITEVNKAFSSIISIPVVIVNAAYKTAFLEDAIWYDGNRSDYVKVTSK